MVRHETTWTLNSSGAGLFGFSLLFFFLTGNRSLRTGSPSPPELISSPPLVAAVLIALNLFLISSQGAGSPGSGRMGVICALL